MKIIWCMIPEIWSMTEFFVILSFCHQFFITFYLLNSLKNENFKKMRKTRMDISSFYTSVPKIMIIGYTVPETWHVTDVIVIFHFGLFFALSPRNSPKNDTFKKMKRKREDMILYNCTKNHDHMLYCSWDMVHDGCNCYFSFQAIFCLFTQVYQKSWSYAMLFLRHGVWQM